MTRLSMASGIAAFLLWCVTDTSLKPGHVRNSNGKTTIWGILSVVLVQIVLWVLAGLCAAWIAPHLFRFFLTGWRLPLTDFSSTFWQWFAVLMVLQYVWTIVRATLSTAVVTVMAAFGFQWAKHSLDDGPRRVRETERIVGTKQK
jgi:hypothetical protein